MIKVSLALGLLCCTLSLNYLFAEDWKGGAMQATDAVGRLNSQAPAGNYQPLTVWAAIKIGSLYYVSPQRAETTGIAYTYDGPEFSDQARNRTIWQLAEDGKISFGISDKQTSTIKVISLAELKKLFSISDASDLPRILARDDVRIVTTDSKLLGETAKTTVIKPAAPANTK
jgi:hypothetical protein